MSISWECLKRDGSRELEQSRHLNVLKCHFLYYFMFDQNMHVSANIYSVKTKCYMNYYIIQSRAQPCTRASYWRSLLRNVCYLNIFSIYHIGYAEKKNVCMALGERDRGLNTRQDSCAFSKRITQEETPELSCGDCEIGSEVKFSFFFS